MHKPYVFKSNVITNESVYILWFDYKVFEDAYVKTYLLIYLRIDIDFILFNPSYSYDDLL